MTDYGLCCGVMQNVQSYKTAEQLLLLEPCGRCSGRLGLPIHVIVFRQSNKRRPTVNVVLFSSPAWVIAAP